MGKAHLRRYAGGEATGASAAGIIAFSAGLSASRY